MVVQAKVLRGVWTLPTTPCAETTRRFTDVHCADPDWAYIETFAAQGITSGCGSGMYCPETVVARDQMAVFLLKIEHGGSYTPPMCTPPGSFLDVPCPAYQFANAIYRAQFEGLTNGCDATHYCPTTAVTETALATFLNKLVLDVQAYHGIQGGSFYTLRDEGNRLVTEFQDSMPARDNVYLGNLLVASYVSKTPTNATPLWQFHVSDHLGTIRASVRGSDGFVSEQHRYWPYGDEVGTPPLAQRLSFAAMEKDTESTHYYDHARTQDFGLGRFASPDMGSRHMADPQTWNRYVYSRGNPVKFVDPNGRYFVATSPQSKEYFARAFAAISLDSRGRDLLSRLSRDARPIFLSAGAISGAPPGRIAVGGTALWTGGMQGPRGPVGTVADVRVDFGKLAGLTQIGARDQGGIATTAHELLHVDAGFFQGAVAALDQDSRRADPDISAAELFGVEIALSPDSPESGISEQEAADLIQNQLDPSAEPHAEEIIESLEAGRCAITNVCGPH